MDLQKLMKETTWSTENMTPVAFMQMKFFKYVDHMQIKKAASI